MRAARQSADASGNAGDSQPVKPSAGPLASRAVGTAGDDAVRALAENGQLCSAVFESHLMRLPAEDLAAMLSAAATMALRNAPAATPEVTTGDGAADLGALGRQLGEVQAQAARSMQMITDGLTAAMAKVGERTGMRGDPSLYGLQALLDDAGTTLDVAAAQCAAVAGTPAGSAGGRGGDDAGLIAAEVDETGTTVGLTLHPAVMRLASQDIGEGVVVAVNRALAARRQALADQAQAPQVDLETLAGHVRGLQGQGVQRMRSQTQGLTSIMASIREP